MVLSLGPKNLFGSSLGEDSLKATRFHHWIAKDPMSIGVICNLEWDYEDGSTSRVSQHVPDHRIKENERHHLAVAWSRLRAWRHRELLYAKDLTPNDLDKRIYCSVTIN